MSDVTNPEKYEFLKVLDNSSAALKDRLSKLQPSLIKLMAKANGLFDDVYPLARYQPCSASGSQRIVFSNWTETDICPIERVPKVRELTVVLGAGDWVKVFRNAESCGNDYPRERLWRTIPTEEEGVKQRLSVWSEDKPIIGRQYQVETADYGQTGILGFVGGGFYYGQEPYIAEADRALDDARQIAQDHCMLMPDTDK